MPLGLQRFPIQCALSRLWCSKLTGVKDSEGFRFVFLSCIGSVLEPQRGYEVSVIVHLPGDGRALC
jgi:hypothetical protein